MNTLTKVFVVLLVIFSITFTMMTIQFSVSQPNWKEQAEKFNNLAQMTNTYNRNLIAAKVAESAKAAADRAAWDEERKKITETNTTMLKEMNDLKARIEKFEVDTTALNATVKKLTAELSVAQTSAEKARDHRDKLEKDIIDLQRRNLDLNDAYNEKIATITVLEQQSRQMEQAVNLLKSERDKLLKKMRLSSSGAEESTVTMPTDKVTAARPAQVQPIRGKIQEVSGDYATISVGTDDGVELGMVFIIYNQQGYLGDLLISDIQPKSAAGKLKNLNGQIGIGDMVADENGYLAMGK